MLGIPSIPPTHCDKNITLFGSAPRVAEAINESLAHGFCVTYKDPVSEISFELRLTNSGRGVMVTPIGVIRDMDSIKAMAYRICDPEWDIDFAVAPCFCE